jgi:mono/diheme cytochrome c family protein
MKILTLIVAGALGLASSHAALAQDQASLSAGRRIASAQCGRCHAIDRQGDSLNPRAPRFRDLAAKYPLDDLREALAEGMIVGHPALMPKITLTPAQIDDLIAYMKTLQPRSAEGRRPRLRPIGSL